MNYFDWIKKKNYCELDILCHRTPRFLRDAMSMTLLVSFRKEEQLKGKKKIAYQTRSFSVQNLKNLRKKKSWKR